MTRQILRIQRRITHQITHQWKSDYHSLKSELKYSYFEAFLSSFIIGIAESFFAAFAIEKGMSTIQSGLLLSLPPILAVAMNLLVNSHIQKTSVSQKVKRNVLLQMVSMGGLMAFSASLMTNTSFSFWSLLTLYSLYWYGYFSSLPAWNLWISELLKADRGHGYFTLRTRMIQVGVITGLVCGGAILQWNTPLLTHAHLFGLIFATAFFALLLKYYSFHKHQNSTSVVAFSLKNMKKIFFQNKKFFSTYGLFNGSLFLSTPYVTGYLLTIRHTSYFQFMLITASLFAGKIMTTYLLNLKKNPPSPMRLMAVGGMLGAPLPFLWPFCENVESMYALNFTSGMSWALWEIGLSLIFFKNIPAQSKIETITLYNTVGIATQMVGTAIGALLIRYVFKYDYTTVFIFAGIIRFLCVLPFQKNKSLSFQPQASNISSFNRAS